MDREDMSELESLVASAQAGEQAALELLIQRHVPSIASHVRSRLGRSLRRQFDTDDIAQSIVREVCRDLGALEYRGRHAFHAWLRVKAKNKINSIYRKHYRRAELRRQHVQRYACGYESRADQADAAEHCALAHSLLDSLPPTGRLIVWMRIYEDRPFAEIASELALPGADAARKRYRRALDRLKESLRL